MLLATPPTHTRRNDPVHPHPRSPPEKTSCIELPVRRLDLFCNAQVGPNKSGRLPLRLLQSLNLEDRLMEVHFATFCDLRRSGGQTGQAARTVHTVQRLLKIVGKAKAKPLLPTRISEFFQILIGDTRPKSTTLGLPPTVCRQNKFGGQGPCSCQTEIDT